MAELQQMLMLLAVIAAAAAQSLSSHPDSQEVTVGGAFNLTCRAEGPASELSVRLACPLTDGAGCFEDCRRPACAGVNSEDACRLLVPELMEAECSLRREPLLGGGRPRETVIAEFRFPRAVRRHAGIYTCQFMQDKVASLVKIVDAPTTAAATSTTTPMITTEDLAAVHRISTRKTTTPTAIGAVLKTPTGTKYDDGKENLHPGDSTAINVSMTPATVGSTEEPQTPGDWLKVQIYGPITQGHVILGSLVLVGSLITVGSLILGLCCLWRRSRRRRSWTKRRGEESGYFAPHNRYLSEPDIPTPGFVTDSSAVGTPAATTTDSSWNSSPIYAEVESPLLSGGGAGRRQQHHQHHQHLQHLQRQQMTVAANFGSQGANLNGSHSNQKLPAPSSGSASFFSRDQVGRHSFHSVRQQQHHQISASQLQQPDIIQGISTHQAILTLVASQQAEIIQLSQQLRDSQRQMDRLAASQVDLHRCLSSTRIRRPSSPQQHSLSTLDAGSSEVFRHPTVGSLDALTVDTIDEEFEADGTLRTPAKGRSHGPMASDGAGKRHPISMATP